MEIPRPHLPIRRRRQSWITEGRSPPKPALHRARVPPIPGLGAMRALTTRQLFASGRTLHAGAAHFYSPFAIRAGEGVFLFTIVIGQRHPDPIAPAPQFREKRNH
jgi:hypothetical protein